MLPLVLLAATTVRTDLVMAAAVAAALLVLPDGSGLARFAKLPGALLMTAVLVAVLVRHRRRAAARARPVSGSAPAPGSVPAPGSAPVPALPYAPEPAAGHTRSAAG